VVELHPSKDQCKADLQSLENWLETTGTLELGRNSAQVVTEASMKLLDLRFVRDPVCSDIPQTAQSSMSATGTSGSRSSLCTFSPVR